MDSLSIILSTTSLRRAQDILGSIVGWHKLMYLKELSLCYTSMLPRASQDFSHDLEVHLHDTRDCN